MNDAANTPITLTMTAAQWAAIHAVMCRSVGVWDEITPVIRGWEAAYSAGARVAADAAKEVEQQ